MFEGLVADALTRILGEYVRGLDKDSIKVGVWSGKLQLQQLELHSEAVASLLETMGMNIPITVQAGKIGSLKVEVPWKRLRSQPIRIILSEMTVVTTPARAAGPDALALRHKRIKLAKLATDDALREARWSESKVARTVEQSSRYSRIFGGVTSRLLTSIVDNIQIELWNVLIRYEDSVSDEQHPFCINMELAALRLLSTDSQWNVVFTEDPSLSRVHKLVQLSALVVKYSHLRRNFDPTEIESLRSHVQELLRSNADDTNFISPINGTVRATMWRPGAQNRPADKGQPQVTLDVHFETMEVSLNDFQYSSILRLSNELARFKQRGGDDRPRTPRDRWLWALDRILPGFQERRRNDKLWTDKGIRDWARRSELYVSARVSVLKARRAGVEQKAEQDAIITLEVEDELPVKELIALREAVDGLLEQEDLQKGEAQDQPVTGMTSSRIRSFFRRQVGTKIAMVPWEEDADGGEEKEVAYANKLVADLEGQEILTKPVEGSEASDAPRLKLGFTLNSGSLEVISGAFESSCKHTKKIAMLELRRLQLGVVSRPAQGNILVEALLGSLVLRNTQTNEKLLYPTASKDNHRAPETNARGYPVRAAEALVALRRSGSERDVGPEIRDLIALRITRSERSSPSGKAGRTGESKSNLSVEISIGGVEAIVDGPRGSLVSCCTFWQSKGQNVDAIMSMLSHAAKERLQALRQHIKQGMSTKQSTVDLDVFLEAPRIFLPGQTPQEPTLFVDLGNLSLETKDSGSVSLPQSRSQLSSTMYVTTIKNLSASVSSSQAEHTNQVLSPVSVTVTAEIVDDPAVASVSIEDAQSLARVRVSGVLPSLHLSLSQETYRKLLRLVKVWKQEFRSAQSLPTSEEISDSFPTETQSFTDAEQRRVADDLAASPESVDAGTIVPRVVLDDLDLRFTLQDWKIELTDRSRMKFVAVAASNSTIQLVKGQQRLHLDYQLQQFQAIDFRKEGTSRRFVFAGSEAPDSTPDLRTFIHIVYEQNERTMTQEVQAKVLQLDCKMVRETVVAVVRFLYGVEEGEADADQFADPFAAAGTSATAAAKLLRDKAEVVLERSRDAIQKHGRLTVSTEFDGLKLLVTSDSSGDVSAFDITDLQLRLDRSSQGNTTAAGRFKSIRIINLETAFEEQRVFLEYIGSRNRLGSSEDSYVISVVIPNPREGNPSVSARFESLRIVFVQQFLYDLKEYFQILGKMCKPIVARTERVELQEVLDRTDSHRPTSTAPRKVKLAVTTEGIDIIFPRHSKNNHEAVRATIASVAVDNGDPPSMGYNFAFNLTLNCLTTYALYPLFTEKTPFTETMQLPHIAPILNELNITAKMDYWRQGDKFEEIDDNEDLKHKTLTETNPHHRLPAIRIRTRPVDGIKVSFCEAQYSVLCLVFSENFIEPQAPSYDELLEQAERNLAEEFEAPSNAQPPALQLLLNTSKVTLDLIAGAEARSETNALLGIVGSDFSLNFDVSTNSRISVELDAKIDGFLDQRPQANVLSPEVVTSRSGRVAEITVSVDRPFLRQSHIMVMLKDTRLVVEPELFAQIGRITIPGYPFLPTSAPGFNMPFTGRSMVINFIRIEVLLFTDAYKADPRCAVLRGDLSLKLKSKAFSGEREVSIGTRSTVLGLANYEGRNSSCGVEPEATPVLFPSDLLFELGNAGPSASDGRVIHLSSNDAVMCRLAMQDVKVVLDVVQRCRRIKVPPGPDTARRPVVETPPLPPALGAAPAAGGLTWFVSLSALRVVFSDEPGDTFVPIMEARLGRMALCSRLHFFKMSGELAVDLFARGKGWWVPGVEPFPVDLTVKTEASKRSMVVQSTDVLDANVTPVTIDGAMRVVRTFQEAIQSLQSSADSVDQPRERRRRPGSSAFVIRNETGMDVSIWTPFSSVKTTLRGDGEEREVEIPGNDLVGSSRAARRADALRCFVAPNGFGARELSVAELQTDAVSFQPGGLDLIWDVQMRGGLPVGTIRTSYRVVNHTPRDLEIQCGDRLLSVPKNGGSKSVPVDSLQEALQLRPLSTSAGSYEWSVPLWGKDQFQKSHRNASLYSRSQPGTTPAGGGGGSRSTLAPVCASSDVEGASKSSWWLVKSGRGLRELAAMEGEAWQFVVCEPTAALRHGKRRSFALTVEAEFGPQGKWLDVRVKVPLLLENALPRPLRLRLYRRTGGKATRLASFRLQPLELVPVFVPCAVSELWVEVACGRNVAAPAGIEDDEEPSFSRGFLLAEVGARDRAMSLGRDAGGNTSAARVELARSGCSLRACFYADLWLRNRSDVDLEVKAWGTEGISSSVALLPGRPPGLPADSFVCALGPFVAFRDVNADKWNPLGYEAAELTRPVELLGLENRNLLLKAKAARGGFQRTVILTIRVALWLENLTGRPLQWCHTAALDKRGITVKSSVHDVKEGEVSAIHYSQWGLEPSVRLRLAEADGSSDWIWSCAVNADRARSIAAKIYNPKNSELFIARTRVVKLRGGSRKIVVYSEDRSHPPYMLVNRCASRAICFSQVDADHLPWMIAPGTTSRYSWDDPLVPPQGRSLRAAVIEDVGTAEQKSLGSFELGIDVPTHYEKELGPGMKPLYVSIGLSGPTKVVTFSDSVLDRLPSLEQPTEDLTPVHTPVHTPMQTPMQTPVQTISWDDLDGSPGVDGPTAADDLEQEPPADAEEEVANGIVLAEGSDGGESPSAEATPEEPTRTLDLEVLFHTVGISLVDDVPEELVYMTLRGPRFRLERRGAWRSITVAVQELQVDNQLVRPTWPVLLWSPSPIPRETAATAPADGSSSSSEVPEEEAPRQFLELTLSLDDTVAGITTVKGAYGAVQEMQLSVDEEWVMRIWLLVQTFVEPSARRVDEVLGADDGESRLLYSQAGIEEQLLHCIYAEHVLLAPVKLVLNLASSRTPLPRRPGRYWGLIKTLIATFGNVENAEFRINALELHHAFDTSQDLSALVGEFYLRQLNKQKLTLVASNQLLGSPSVLFDHISTGARDFFVEPYKVRTGAEFLPELYKGSTSLIGNTVGGIVGAVGSIPKALAGTMESALSDRDYALARSAIYANHRVSKNFGQGLARGAMSLGHGISSGVAGLFRDPIRGAYTSGAAGFFRGLGKGVIGGVLKPLTGALDLIAEPTMGLRTAFVTNKRMIALPFRPPRVFSGVRNNRRLITYDYGDSIAADVLAALRRKKAVPESVVELRGWVLLSADRELGPAAVWQVLSTFTRGITGQKRVIDAIKGSGRSAKTRIALVTKNNNLLLLVTLDLRLLWSASLADIVSTEGSIQDPTALLIASRHRSAAKDRKWFKVRCGSQEARDELYQLVERAVTALHAGANALEENAEGQSEVSPEGEAEWKAIELLAEAKLAQSEPHRGASAHRSVYSAVVNRTDVSFHREELAIVSGSWVTEPPADLPMGEAEAFEVESGSGLTADLHGSVSYRSGEHVIVLNFVNLFLAEKAYFADCNDGQFEVRTAGDVEQEHARIIFAIVPKRSAVPLAADDKARAEEGDDDHDEDTVVTEDVANIHDGGKPAGPTDPSAAACFDRPPAVPPTDVNRERSASTTTSTIRADDVVEDSTLEQLTLLGFDHDTAQRALQRSEGDMVAAVDLLLAGKM